MLDGNSRPYCLAGIFVQHRVASPVGASSVILWSNVVLRWEWLLMFVVSSECPLLFLVMLTPFI
jgi:hypothetical protein